GFHPRLQYDTRYGFCRIHRTDGNRRHTCTYDIFACLCEERMALDAKAGYPSRLAVPADSHAEQSKIPLPLDFLDRNLRVRLAMTLLSAVVLLRLILEDDDLLAFAVLLDFARYRCACNNRLAKLNAVAVAYCKNLIE